jgi:hypothetical protein
LAYGSQQESPRDSGKEKQREAGEFGWARGSGRDRTFVGKKCRHLRKEARKGRMRARFE